MTPEAIVVALREAETKQASLLAEMNAIDAQLSGLQPSDPKRVGLKAAKAEIVPRYRGAKEHAKNLRRVANSVPPVNSPNADNDISITAAKGSVILRNTLTVGPPYAQVDVSYNPDQVADWLPEPLPTLADAVVPDDILLGIYETATALLDRHHSNPNRARGPLLLENEVRALDAFVLWWED